MLTSDATILKIKHEVLYQAAKLAFEGKFDEGKDAIPYLLVPGPKAKFRCCIYREREIIRQRVRLAEGKNPRDNDSANVVQVIQAACEDCQISRYTVTDNCRKCMQKACQSACKFGAITMGRDRSYIDPSKCKECGACAKACPYNAIADLVRPCKQSCPTGAITMDKDGLCVIDEDKCIQCGKCVHSCPFGAIGTKTYIVDIIKAMNEGKKVFAMLAPAAEGQFGPEITMASWKTAMKAVGFEDLIELGLGGDLTADAEAKEWTEAYREGKKLTTSCCPAFVNLIKKHFPEFEGNISRTVSPMVAVSRMLKAEYPGCVTVFIGPCIAKKAESQDKSIKGNADYALTFGEIRAMMRAKSIQLEADSRTTQEASVYGKRFGNSGGVTAAVIECMKEKGVNEDIKVSKCNGAEECKKALTLWKYGKFDDDFIEGMACVGGCVGGPSRHRDENVCRKNRDQLISSADTRTVGENLSNYDLNKINMDR